MNDEYLWQKTGDDAGVRELERALEVFRYRETDPPVLPVAIPRAGILRWRFPGAIAATAFATLLIGIGIWSQMAGPKDRSDVTFVSYPETQATERPADERQTPGIQPPAPKQPIRRTRPDVRSAPLRAVRRSPAKPDSRKNSTVVLSRQERYAYERLLLALSISSSKINIVRNTIDGVEENEDAPRQNNR